MYLMSVKYKGKEAISSSSWSVAAAGRHDLMSCHNMPKKQLANSFAATCNQLIIQFQYGNIDVV